MSLLTAAPPRSISLGGADFPINPDFRNILAISKLLSDSEDESAIFEALNRFYTESIPPDAEQAVNGFIDFFTDKSDKKSSAKGKVVDFDFDADYIFAAFLNEYNIDLSTIETMHWWTFRALFTGLKHSKINDIIQIRATDITKDMSAAEKKYYTEMKRVFALPREKKRISPLERALMNGESLEGLI